MFKILTHRAVVNTRDTLGAFRAAKRMRKAGWPIDVALFWIAGFGAVRRYYERDQHV